MMKHANFEKKNLYCTKRRCSQIKPQLKVKKEDGREACPKSLVLYNCRSALFFLS